MDDKQNRAAARKSALKELLEGAGMAALGALMWMLGGDFTFVEGVTTRSEGRTQMYLMAGAAALIIIGAVFLVLGLIHLARPGKGARVSREGTDGASPTKARREGTPEPGQAMARRPPPLPGKSACPAHLRPARIQVEPRTRRSAEQGAVRKLGPERGRAQGRRAARSRPESKGKRPSVQTLAKRDSCSP